ncbi:MAG: hypothetical protein IJX92_05545 [Clostridia bacterium]|nr:hypothetical protein [Clostridia bacterium]
MSEQTPDISRVIQLIMENPSLVQEISSLVKKDGASESNCAPEASEESSVVASEQITVPVTTAPKIEYENPARRNRTQLLGAMKPYVSSERAKAIDSMMSIMDILEMMKAR